MPAVDMRNIFLRPSRSMFTPLSWARIKFHRAEIGSEPVMSRQSGTRRGKRLTKTGIDARGLVGIGDTQLVQNRGEVAGCSSAYH
jgi:hypothetical protein